jgi:hypothetical protein
MKKVWEFIKRPFVAIHEWLKERMPGLKTKLVAAAGAISSAAALMQEYITGIPLAQLLGVTEALIVSTVLFTLAFWFRAMSK